MPTITIRTPTISPDSASVEYFISDLPSIVTHCQLGIQIVQIGTLRDSLAAMVQAPAKASDGAISGTATLMEGARAPGIYAINQVAITSSDGMQNLIEPGSIGGLPAYFRVSGDVGEPPLSPADIADLARKREALITTEWVTPASTAAATGTTFSVFVFCAPTLLHEVHHLKGYSIYPLTGAISEESYRQAMNAFTMPSLGVQLQPDENLSRNFRAGAPAVVIALHSVRALSPDDAIEFALNHAKQVAIVLGIGRGQKPTPFGVASRTESEVRHGYIFAGYRGNYISPMLDEVEQQLESLLPKAQKSPWARLLMSDYAAATAETDHGFQYLRYWSLIELIAKHHITSDNQQIFFPTGQAVTSASGTAVLTKGAKAKVYAHLMNTGVFSGVSGSPTGQNLHFEGDQPDAGGHGNEVIALWNWLGAAYHIRNSVAHTGQYEPNMSAAPQSDAYWAARLFPHGAFFGHFRDSIKIAMFRELEQITV